MATETKRGVAWAAVASILLALVGWVISVENRLAADQMDRQQNSARLDRVENQAQSVGDYMRSIDQRLARIEGKLEQPK